MINPCTQYKVMRGSGLTRWGAMWFVLLLIVVSPFIALSLWAAPDEDGFGKFRERDDDAS